MISSAKAQEADRMAIVATATSGTRERAMTTPRWLAHSTGNRYTCAQSTCRNPAVSPSKSVKLRPFCESTERRSVSLRKSLRRLAFPDLLISFLRETGPLSAGNVPFGKLQVAH